MSQNAPQILTCKSCGAELTHPLIAITTVAEMQRICQFTTETPISPPRRYLRIEGEIKKNRMRFAKGWIPEGDAWVNLEDLTKTVTLTEDPKRLSGCCDVSGCNGPNRVCSCGKYVGTQSSDCYEYRLFEPLIDATVWKTANIMKSKEND